MREKIKQYLGEVFAIIGAGIFSYNLFNFKYNAVGLRSSLPPLPPSVEQPNVVIAYY